MIQLIIVSFLTIFIYYYKFNSKYVEVVFWNTLCEALGANQFMTNGGDYKNVSWNKRKYIIAEKIADQLSQGRIVTCVEVDNFSWIFNYIKTTYPKLNINGICMPKIITTKNNSNNNLSIYITNLLNHYDKNIEIVPNLTGEKLTNTYIKLIEFVKDDTLCDFPTFNDNSVSETYLEFLSYIIGMPLTMDMPYASFDCSVIFWSENKYIIEELLNTKDKYGFNTITINPSEIRRSENGWEMNDIGFMGARFRKRIQCPFYAPSIFDIYVAHIKSGENSSGELERAKSMGTILETININSNDNHILCMDSNTSSQYQNKIKKGEVKNKKDEIIGYLDYYVSEIWNQFNYQNCIQQTKDTICWKIRAGSEQIKKNGELMADAIDVMLVPKNILYEQFIPYESNITEEDYNYIMLWRNKELFRKTIKSNCNYEKNMWGLDFNKNLITPVFSKFLLNNPVFPKNSSKEEIEQVSSIFRKMYPNPSNPSDHPMIGAKIYLNKKII